MNKNKNLKNLMIKAKNGDSRAFGYIFDAYFTPIYRYIYLRTGNKELTEDLAQTVFLKIYKSINNYQDIGKNPLAYFFTVARNAITDYYKKKKAILIDKPLENFISLKNEKLSPLHSIEEKEKKELIKFIIKQLNKNQQEIIILKFIEGLSNKEIAKLIGKKEDAIRQLQCRAIKNLRQKFKNLSII